MRDGEPPVGVRRQRDARHREPPWGATADYNTFHFRLCQNAARSAMEKLVYLLWREPSEDADAFARRLVARGRPEARRRAAPGRSRVNAADREADLGRTVPIRDSGAAVRGSGLVLARLRGRRARLRGDPARRRARAPATSSPSPCRATSTSAPGPTASRSPGVKMISVFEQPARLSRAEFIARWHGSHTPLSLEIHPLWRYVRNVVARPLTAGAPDYRPGSSRSTCASSPTSPTPRASTAAQNAWRRTSSASSTTRGASSTSSESCRWSRARRSSQ